MAEFERIPLRSRPDRNWLPGAVSAVALLIGLAIVKPWDAGGTGTGGATPAPTFYVGPTERTGPRPYDPILFGGREPDPGWELWPAGYVVEFGMTGPVRVQGQDRASAAPGGSRTPGPSAPGPTSEPPATSNPSPAAGRSPVPSAPPATPSIDDGVDLGTTAHLVALGINTPADVHVETVTLSRLTDAGTTLVPVVRLPTFFESDHFLVIAPEDPAAPGQATPWSPGLYRLALTSTIGEVRIIDLRVRPPSS